MKLIIIYGPPAAGKLTVANAIAERTEFRVFHNHLSIDCVKPAIEFGTPAFWRVVGDVRDTIISTAMREGISLVHTFCYEFGADDDYFRKIIAGAESNGGEVHLVLLTCSDDERRKRISNESRIMIGKLTDPDAVGRNNINLTTPLPGRETLMLDTTELRPEIAAMEIIEHYQLQRQPARS
jgi:hypothetical protein